MAANEDVPPSDIAVPRRTALAFGLAAATGLATAGAARAEAAGGVKVTALYGAPKDPAAFEKYYAEKHMPIVYPIKGISKIELGKPMDGPDGKPPAFYRITELWFDSAEQLQKVTATDEWKKVIADIPNFASGGVTVLVSKLG